VCVFDLLTADGVSCQENYVIAPDERYDKIPEIWEGHNIADFVDVNIKAKLQRLHEEERQREQAGFYDSDVASDDEADKQLLRQAEQ